MENTTSNISYHAYSSLAVDYDAVEKAEIVIYSTFCIVGVPVNLWLLVAILTSMKLRSQLKNKLICGLLLTHVLELGVFQPFLLVAKYLHRRISCGGLLFIYFTHFIENSISNWTIFWMLAVLLAKYLDAPVPRCIPEIIKPWLGILLTALPWVLPLIYVPTVNAALSGSSCIRVHQKSLRVFSILDVFLVLSLALVLLVLVLLARRRRFNGGSMAPGSQGLFGSKIELIGRGTDVDDVGPYIVILVVTVLSDIPPVVMSMREVRQAMQQTINHNDSFIIVMIAWMIAMTRALILPAVFMLMRDLRERIMTWRPWYRPAPGIDLTVAYSRDQD